MKRLQLYTAIPLLLLGASASAQETPQSALSGIFGDTTEFVDFLNSPTELNSLDNVQLLAKKGKKKKGSSKEAGGAKKSNKSKKGGGGKIITDMKYVTPSLEKRKEDAKLAISFLGKKHSDYPAAKYLKQLAAVKDDAGIDALRYDALVLNNPVITFDKLLVRSSGSQSFPANWQGNSTYLRRQGKESSPSFDDEIQVLNLKDKSLKTIYKPSDAKEGLMDICLDYSGKKFLYSGVHTKTKTFQVYEMNIDGTGKRQITPILPQIDNYNGIYLPNGKILFCSTASLNSVPCVGGKDYVGTLFEIKKDGTGMRQVSFDQENDWYPWVKEDGRVMYHRWEYTDNSHYFTRILLEMNPDGTNNRSIYGSNSYWPNTLFYAKQVPGHPSKFVGIVSGHHGVKRAGELHLFDSSKGDFEADGALQRIPGRGVKVEPVIIDRYADGRWPLFLHPYPLSENFFLVSGKIKPTDKWSLYLVDTFDNVIKLKEDSKFLFEPIPLTARKTPPVIPERRNLDAKDATLYIQDIYTGPGLEGVERGTVAALRLFAYGYAYRMTGNHDALAIEGGWDTKRVLGTVPVEKDGSVMCKIPHSLPISIQPIDKDGNALQVMRSWTAAQPGEVVSCIGCHESSTMAPSSRPAMASRKAPQKLTPWSKYDRPYGFGFIREVQPVLDKYCVGCHDGSKTVTKDGHAIPNFKETKEMSFKGSKSDAHFGISYLSLHPYVRRPGPESDLHILTPMDYHTSTSELFQMLRKGHHGVKVDKESMDTLRTWVDLNIPYHATWSEYKNDENTKELAARTVEYKKKYAGIDDAIEWMPKKEARPAFVKPAKEKRPAAMKLNGWPLKSTAKLESKEISFGKSKLTFVKVPAGKFVMGSVTGAPDEYPQAVVTIEKPFWMSTTEITNAQLREYNPKHDSKVIDQQWKDHIYAGYPANEDTMPAIRVTWNEAMAFSKWLGGKLGEKVKLPTEGQWEWAARAGSDQPYFFGDSGYGKYGNFADKQIGLFAVKGVNPKPVGENARTPLNDFVPRDKSFDDGKMIPTGTGEYKPNPWGLFDMHGNVAEWTRSAYKQYPYKDGDGRNDVSVKAERVARGGSWRDRPKTATASYRVPYVQFQKVYNVGFRVIIEE